MAGIASTAASFNPVTAGIAGGSALIGAGLNYLSSQDEIRAQREAQQAQQRMYEQAVQQYQTGLGQATPYLQPFATGGMQAYQNLNQLIAPGQQASATNMTNNFRNDPQYQAIMQQALSAVRNGAAGKGGSFSGQINQDLMEQAGKIADQAYQQIYSNKLGAYNNQISNLTNSANVGREASQGLAQLYTGTNDNIAKTLGEIGQGQSAGITGVAGAGTNMLSNLNQAFQGGLGMYLNQNNANNQSAGIQAILDKLKGLNPSSYGDNLLQPTPTQSVQQ